MEIVRVNEKNLSEYPQVICFINKKHESHPLKLRWLEQQFSRGLQIRLLFEDPKKAAVGYIETIPGESAWRGVRAEGYLFIHCLWINGNKYKNQGLGHLLIEEAEKESRNMKGTAVITSTGSFMSGSEVFLKYGYSAAEERGKEQLLYKSPGGAPPPRFSETADPAGYRGWNILYTSQCPWVARSIAEIRGILNEKGLEAEIRELMTPEEVRNGPTVYGGFSLIHDGEILADRYISATRFRNILKKRIGR